MTAGHCDSDSTYNIDILEFNVPASNSDGTINFADPDDQYAINRSTIRKSFTYIPGDDWAVFDCYANSNTGLKPVQAQQAFHRMSRLDPGSTLRLTGYGGDSQQANNTQQTATGPYVGTTFVSSSNVSHYYDIDESARSSGSPILDTSGPITIALGVHNDSRCDRPGLHNSGTSFDNDNLESILNKFPGYHITRVYADKDHPDGEDGGVLQPYDTVQEAVNEVSTGGIVSIVKGYYNETMTISKAMTITAPVGMVTIGASGLGKLLAGDPVASASTSEDTAGSLIPTSFSLSPAYPNPFNPNTTINYALKEDVRATLKVYDLLGREVRVLVYEHQPAAYHSVVWDGRDRAGRPLPSGIYIARLVAGDFVAGIKMVLLK
ncbi:MAG: T9SS type A sorting domain-containing protein [Candidatus Marinimicrobia bacterium]|nr:T9SS type A sorting domain-containing protein [Candidatus Neomarinimicrobiota bacterium]